MHCIRYVLEHLRARALRSVGDSIKVLARARLNGGRGDRKRDESSVVEARWEEERWDGGGGGGGGREKYESRGRMKSEKRKRKEARTPRCKVGLCKSGVPRTGVSTQSLSKAVI